jgi:hypothetical protein
MVIVLSVNYSYSMKILNGTQFYQEFRDELDNII